MLKENRERANSPTGSFKFLPITFINKKKILLPSYYNYRVSFMRNACTKINRKRILRKICCIYEDYQRISNEVTLQEEGHLLALRAILISDRWGCE